VWFVPNDDNRAEDGKDLRYEFIREKKLDVEDRDWLEQGCCMLELFLGLSRRLAFETSAEPVEWFWELMENLDLSKYNDQAYIPEKEVDDILDRVIWRTYRRNGHGGLFPLQRTKNNQREVELWYQLSEYVLERT
jgi:hypothetical protein